MNPAAVVAIVFALMFLIGITVGFIIVIAMSVIRGPRPGAKPPRSGANRTTDDEDADDDDQPAVSGIPGRWDAGPSWPGDSDTAR
jgi:hypothetical protein